MGSWWVVGGEFLKTKQHRVFGFSIKFASACVCKCVAFATERKRNYLSGLCALRSFIDLGKGGGFAKQREGKRTNKKKPPSSDGVRYLLQAVRASGEIWDKERRGSEFFLFVFYKR